MSIYLLENPMTKNNQNLHQFSEEHNEKKSSKIILIACLILGSSIGLGLCWPFIEAFFK